MANGYSIFDGLIPIQRACIRYFLDKPAHDFHLADEQGPITLPYAASNLDRIRQEAFLRFYQSNKADALHYMESRIGSVAKEKLRDRIENGFPAVDFEDGKRTDAESAVNAASNFINAQHLMTQLIAKERVVVLRSDEHPYLHLPASQSIWAIADTYRPGDIATIAHTLERIKKLR